VCHGSTGTVQLQATCYGQMLNGQRTGPQADMVAGIALAAFDDRQLPAKSGTLNAKEQKARKSGPIRTV
jgi:hypothetical protein